MMNKILIITPHLSTGGLPQYLYKRIELLKNEYDFYVVEWSDITGGEFVVQRNKIIGLLGDKFHTLYENKELIFDIVKNINPDVIHFEELPETFIEFGILDKIYEDTRDYNIVVSTHSSFTEPESIKYLGDKIVLPSEWLLNKFNNYFNNEIPCELWEYPIESIEYDKDLYKKLLGFDPSYKHILHVGLFTPGKNQKELIEVARECLDEKVLFHFVGNQASNFEDYWKPIMDNLPKNCIWHGERSDVDNFYKASDILYFPSIYELNPIVLKEAVGFGLPLLIKPLETYGQVYNKYATYLTDNLLENKKLLLEKLKPKKEPKIQIIHLLTNSVDDRQTKSVNYISKLQRNNINYTQHINNIYNDVPPSDFCARPEHVGKSPSELGNGYGVLTGRHYGCFLAHTNALKSISDEYDYTLIFESDASVETSSDEFINTIYKSVELLESNKDIYFVSFANNGSSTKTHINEYFSLTSCNQDLAHAYLIPNKCKDWYIQRIYDTPWDGYDIWLNNVFCKYGKKRVTTNKIYSNQIEGLSLIDGNFKWGNGIYDYIEIGTSDFDSLLEVLPEDYKGISIEPIKEYLDNLPFNVNNLKLNLLISDSDSFREIFYIDPKSFEQYGLPIWLKGCNSIDKPHPTAQNYLREHNLEHLYISSFVECVSVRTLISRYEIKKIKFLKIDTEGHDFVILRDMLKSNIRPEKIEFEANSLYSEFEIQSMLNELKSHGYKNIYRDTHNITVRLDERDNHVMDNLPILIFSTGRRLEYFTKTVRHLFDKNENFENHFKRVWVLDDRSTSEERFHMDKMMSSYFGDKYNMITFNSNEPFYFVEKFKMIKKLINPEDIVLFIEDDWECHDDLTIPFHVCSLKNSDWTQIAFADPIDIQVPEIQKKHIIDNNYWHNPYPDYFRHPHAWDGNVSFWSTGTINNWTNNPSLIKGEVFFRGDFENAKNFEWDFSQKINGNQVFTHKAIFRHFGENSLINNL